MLNKKLRYISLFTNIIILIIVLISPSLLISIIVQKFGFNNPLYFQILYFIFAMFFCFTFKSKIALTKFQNQIKNIFIIIIIWFFIVWILKYSFTFTATSTKGYILTYSYGILLYYLLNSDNTNLYSFFNAYILLSSILATLSLVQYIGYPIGLIKVSYLTNDITEGLSPYRGIGGYLDTFSYGGAFTWLNRNVGFFSEPTYFSQFLQIPMFLSFALYNYSKKKMYLIHSLLMLCAFILTFSIANIFGFLFAISIYLLLTAMNKKRDFLFRLFLVVLFLGSILFFKEFYNLTNIQKRENIIAKSTDSNIDDRFYRVSLIIDDPSAALMGNINFRHNFRRNLSFFGTCIMGGGYPFALTMFFLLLLIYNNVYKKISGSKFPYLYVGYFSILLPTLWVADFWQTHFVFLLVFVVTFMKWELKLSNHRAFDSNIKGHL